MRLAFSQEKTKEDTITPANTAIAKSNITVSPVTKTMTITSARGTLFQTFKLLHAKVPITTINITPTKAAIGTISM